MIKILVLRKQISIIHTFIVGTLVYFVKIWSYFFLRSLKCTDSSQYCANSFILYFLLVHNLGISVCLEPTTIWHSHPKILSPPSKNISCCFNLHLCFPLTQPKIIHLGCANILDHSFPQNIWRVFGLKLFNDFSWMSTVGLTAISLLSLIDHYY